MKVIKLNRKHHLYHKGFVWAFRFDKVWDDNVWKIEKIVNRHEGHAWPRTFFGKRKNGDRPYYIGFNQEKTATIVFLSIA